MALTQTQKDLLVGTLLGDGCLGTDTRGQTWRYRALHKSAHKDYLDEKYNILQSYCGAPPAYSATVDSRTNKTYYRWSFNTLIDPDFLYYANLFYSFNKKQGLWMKDVPSNIEHLLTPFAVAFWYMDDGCLKSLGNSNAMRICTESFSERGVRRLKRALKNKFKIDTQLNRKTNNGNLVGYRLAINEVNSTPFRNLIQPYLVPCMRYKVSDGNRGHL